MRAPRPDRGPCKHGGHLLTDDRTTARQTGDQIREAAGALDASDVPANDPRHAATRPPLTPEDLRRLTLYKWRYSLESSGFTPDQVGHLLFLKWLYANRVIRG